MINRRRALAQIKRTPPAWVMSPDQVKRRAKLDIDFVNNRAWAAPFEAIPAALLTVTRASPATTYYEQADGSLISFTANVLRIGNRGALAEESRTNVALYCRDLTNAAWTKTNCTAALNQTGVDGGASSASSLTASAGNATCLQAITLSSSARWQTCYIKRISGSGVINMTMDNGTTWTAVTVTGSWARVSIPTQTLANPTVGFQIVTNGDAIAVDFVQNENSSIQATSPIATTSASVTRSADVLTLSRSVSDLITPKGYTVYAQGWGNTPNSGAGALFTFDNPATTDIFYLRTWTSATAGFSRAAAGGSNFSATLVNSNGFTHAGRHKHIIAVQPNDAAACCEDGILVTATGALVPNVTRLTIGSQNSSGWWNGYVERIAVWDGRFSNSDLQLLSAANCNFLYLQEGDSIPNAPASATCFVGYMRSTLAPLGWDIQSVAISGSSLSAVGGSSVDISGAARVATLNAMFSRYCQANGGNPNFKSCLVLWTGHNDYALDGDSTGTFLSQISAYLDARRLENRTGNHKVSAAFVPPSTTAGLNAWRATVNTTISGYVSGHADYVVDLSAVSGCLDADASDTSKWSDGTHPTAAQAQILAAAIKAQALDSAAA